MSKPHRGPDRTNRSEATTVRKSTHDKGAVVSLAGRLYTCDLCWLRTFAGEGTTVFIKTVYVVLQVYSALTAALADTAMENILMKS